MLEARDRVGGRTLAAADKRDLGAGYIGPSQDRMYDLCKRFGLATYKVRISAATDAKIASSLLRFSVFSSASCVECLNSASTQFLS